jgi:hypothetical protein
MDPYPYRKPDPDSHQSEKPDQLLGKHQSEKPGAVAAKWSHKGSHGAVESLYTDVADSKSQ